MGDVSAQFLAASLEKRERLVGNGQMPCVTPEEVADLRVSIRSR